MDARQRQEIALFRYGVIAPLVTQQLTRLEYGRLLQELTRQEFVYGKKIMRIGRRTIQRWVQEYQLHGQAGLEPATRSDARRIKAITPALLDRAGVCSRSSTSWR